MEIPQDLLLSFFQEACKDMNDCKIQGPFSLVDLRNLLLTNQRFCLDRVVDEYNLKHKDNATKWTSFNVQDCLKNLKSQEMDDNVNEAMETMNATARLAFCRLVLYSECLRQQESEPDESSSSKQHANLEKEGPIQRSQLLEFCGLCSAATRLPMVQDFVRDGTDLFHNDTDTTATPLSQTVKGDDPSKNIPPYRLDVIQRLFFRAVEVDPDHGMAEIKRIFFSGENHNDHDELANDAELVSIFQAAVTRMNTMLTDILQQKQQANMAKLSDVNDGGVTRVVAVEYSEKIIDSKGQVVDNGGSSHLGPVSRQAMEQHDSQLQQEQFDVARQAGALQQEILGELFSLPEDRRTERLAYAEEVEKDFLANAMQLPAGPERIAFLRSVDPETQRLMVMRKLWHGMLAAHGGKPPKMQT